jgi:inosine-uridine nucleoside N-ribohydrolase
MTTKPYGTLFLLLCLIATAAFPVVAEPVRIIFDTDMDTDCDDTAALAILHTLANQGEAKILATVASSHYAWSAPCIQAINTYYNRPELPIGVPKKPGASTNRGSRYAKQISTQFPTALTTNSDAPDAVEIYRRILAKQTDTRVVIVTVGYLTNLAYLLDSQSDQYSPLTGRELVQNTVASLVCMGGRYPSHLDPGVFGNFKPDPAAAVKVAKEWPGRIVFTGLGDDVFTGQSLHQTPDTNPVKVAYKLYLGDKPARPSWDLFAVLYAVRPNEPYWDMRKEGTNHIFENGTNEWREQDNPNHWLLQIDPAKKDHVKDLMNKLMATPPTPQK